MKNFLRAVLLGLLLGAVYLGMLIFIIAPLLFMFKEGFIGLMIGSMNIFDFVRNVLGKFMGIPYSLDAYSITIIIVQIILFLSMCTCAYIFLSKVLKNLLTGEGEEYFQMFYKIIFLSFLFIPEILIFMSLFFQYPVIRTILIVSIVVGVITIFATIITIKVLPDVINNRNNKFLIEGEKYE